jgi:hypothetical protein
MRQCYILVHLNNGCEQIFRTFLGSGMEKKIAGAETQNANLNLGYSSKTQARTSTVRSYGSPKD